MKKKYERPFVYMEQFMANQFVAADCSVKITEVKNDAMSCMNPNHRYYDDDEHPVAARVQNVFMVTPSCVTLIPSGSLKTSMRGWPLNSIPRDGAKVYGFYTNVADAVQGGAKVYTANTSVTGIHGVDEAVGADDCYGYYNNSAITSDVIYPYS